MKKDVNKKKAVNNKLKIIITEISKNIALLQIEQNIPICCNGNIVDILTKFTKYFLDKCKIHIEIFYKFLTKKYKIDIRYRYYQYSIIYSNSMLKIYKF